MEIACLFNDIAQMAITGHEIPLCDIVGNERGGVPVSQLLSGRRGPQRPSALLASYLPANLHLMLDGTTPLETTVCNFDDNCFEFVRQGVRSPTVVFECGLGATLDWWTKVLPQVATHATAFAYNRPGYGRSRPTAECRDGDHIVGFLRRFLTTSGINPPFLLVGHSLGGLYTQLFARKYPEEVVGLVLVESTHPEQLMGAGARENWPTWFRIMFDSSFSDVTKAELACTTHTGQALMALPTFKGPVRVLTATGPMGQEGTELARDANAKRRDIVRLNPGAKQIWVEGSHAIPLEKPETVSNAILEILALLRADIVKVDV